MYVVITMRSDFLGDCARFRDLPEAISDSQYLIPRLTRDELQAVITGPIGVRGGRIAPSLHPAQHSHIQLRLQHPDALTTERSTRSSHQLSTGGSHACPQFYVPAVQMPHRAGT